MDQVNNALTALQAAPGLTDGELTVIRRAVLADQSLSSFEADAFFAIDRGMADKPEGWTAFFVESLTDYVLYQRRPTGTLDAAKAEWLVAHANRGCSVTVMALLVNILAEAHQVPEWFLGEVRNLASRNWVALDDVRCGAIPACEVA